MSSFDRIDLTYLRSRAALKWGHLEPGVIPLSVADIDFPPPKAVKDAIAQVLEEDRSPYGNFGGDPDVVAVLCDKLRSVNHIPADPEDVHLIPGTKFSMFMACYYALKPGDEVIICPAPIYAPFIKNIRMAGGIPVYTPVDFNNNCTIDFDLLRRQITPRTRLIMVCNPHNPNGRVLTREELTTLGGIACEYDLLLYADELYEDMIIDGEHLSLASLSEDLFRRTLSCFGFSKAYAIPGYRIAYLVNRGKHMQVLKDIMHDIIVHTDRLAQAAAKGAILAGGPWLAELQEHLARVREYSFRRIAAIPGIRCTKPQATFFLFPDISSFGMTSAAMTAYLRQEARIVVQSGDIFGPCGEGHIRLNCGTTLEVLEEVFDRMERALEKLEPKAVHEARR